MRSRTAAISAALALSFTACASPRVPDSGTMLRDCLQCPELIIIPRGSFQMGGTAEEHQRESVPAALAAMESPARIVTIPRALAVGRFEVTVAEYAAFRKAQPGDGQAGCDVFDVTTRRWEFRVDRSWRDPGFEQTDRHPVTCVNWEEAHGYVTWLSKLTGKRYRLLTEAEWEYVARAGTQTARYWGDRRDQACGNANVSDLTRAAAHGISRAPEVSFQCSDNVVYTAPVGLVAANGFGLHDVQGNVWEWTQDCFTSGYTGAPTDGSEPTNGDCAQHMDRGGSWVNSPKYLRSAARHADLSGRRNDVLGLRVVREVN